MIRIKIHSRHLIHLNFILFLILGVVFVAFDYSLRSKVSSFSQDFLVNFCKIYWPSCLFCLIAIFRSLYFKNHSDIYFAISIWINVYFIIFGQFIVFNKAILVVLFFYCSIAYFFYQLIKSYLNQACYTPRIDPHRLFEPHHGLLTPKVVFENIDQQYLSSMTNWDDETCFVAIKNPGLKINPPKLINLHFNFYDRNYVFTGKLVSSTLDPQGFGIKFSYNKSSLSSWREFSFMIHQMGYQSQKLGPL